MDSLEPWIACVDQLIWKQPKEELEGLAPHLEALLRGCSVDRRLLLRELPDESLAVAIQKEFWCASAFEELFFHRYEEKLTRWFYHWRFLEEDAQDLVQEVYRRFLQNRLGSYDARRPFRAYLYLTAKNLRVDTLRKRRLETAHFTEADEPVTWKNNPENEAERWEFTARLEEAIKRLVPLQQEAIRQAMEDVSPLDIASRLELEVQQVYGLLFRARRHIERELDLPPQTRLYTRREKSKQDNKDLSSVGEVIS